MRAGLFALAVFDVQADHFKILAQYWFRADLMHDHLHGLMKKYDDDMDRIRRKQWVEFETYVVYWLSALFVLVEGINRAGIKDASIQRLFNEHIGVLKGMRNSTYHYSVEKAPMIRDMNWAEELHATIGEVIKCRITSEIRTQRLIATSRRRRRERNIRKIVGYLNRLIFN